MAMDFPASPTPGQTYNGYQWDGTTWNRTARMDMIICSDTPPSNPPDGQLWVRSTNMQQYVWYNDGNSKQWVQSQGVAAAPGLWEPIGQGVYDFTNLSAAGLIIPNMGAYRDIKGRCDFDGTAGLTMHFSSDNGSTFITSAVYIRTEMTYTQTGGNMAVAAVAESQISLTTIAPNPNTNVMADFYFPRFNKAANKQGFANWRGQSAANGNCASERGYMVAQQTACNALRLTGNGTNNGRLILEGVRG